MTRPVKAKVFWPLLFVVLLTDCATKDVAEAVLAPPHTPHEVVGDVVRMTLAYNDGAAFGVSVGPYGRPILGILGVVALAILFSMYRHVEPHARWPAAGLALVAGGAVGNLYDRLWSPHGVVDFIDLGVGTVRFWTFNVADLGVTIGAAILLLTLWRASRDGAAAGGAGRR